MKTKLLFITFILMACNAATNAQGYVPMLNNSTWNITVAGFGGAQDFVVNPAIDVTIGPYTYKKFFDPIFSTDVYLREDVAAKKVYRRVNNADQLLYDFSLQLTNHIVLSDGNDYVVTSINTINVNGGTRRSFSLVHYIGNFAGNSETWVEGVGSNRHPFKPQFELLSDPYVYLTCSAQGGVNIYNHNIANGQPTATDCTMLATNQVSFTKPTVTFSPNPFATELTIASEIVLENATLKMYNILGQVVKQMEHLNGHKITVARENIKSGIYFIQLEQKGKQVYASKIIVADY